MSKSKPPVFEEGDNYKEWKASIEVWQEVTNENEQSQAGLIILSVKNPKARSALLKLRKDDRGNTEKLFQVLDQLHQHEIDPVGELFTIYKAFDRIERGEEESIAEYIHRFSTLYEELRTQHDLTLPDVILSYKLFDGANMNNTTLQMIRMNCQGDLSLKNVSRKFSEAFDFLSSQISNPSSMKSSVKVKEEMHEPIETLLSTKNVKQLSCYICGSVDHFQRDCPHNKMFEKCTST